MAHRAGGRTGRDGAPHLERLPGRRARRLLRQHRHLRSDHQVVEKEPEPPTCHPSEAGHCLQDGRFLATVAWQNDKGEVGFGHAIGFDPPVDDTGAFWFFGRSNVELMVKVLDGCGINGHYWVFAGGLTNVYVGLAVTDTVAGGTQMYENPQGTPYVAIQDTEAFPCQ